MDRELLPEFLYLGDKKSLVWQTRVRLGHPRLSKIQNLGQGDCPQEERKSQLLGQSTIYVGLRIEFHSRLEVVADAEGQNVGAVVSFNSSGFLRGA